MVVKVVLGTMQNARKLVSIVESVPYDAELCNGRYVVNAKSMLGVLSMPNFDAGELHIHTDNEKECEEILYKLLEENLLMDTNDSVARSIYDITVFGEILIDFTSQGAGEDGQTLYARNAEELRQTWLLRPRNWALTLHFWEKREKTCMENFSGLYYRRNRWIPKD